MNYFFITSNIYLQKRKTGVNIQIKTYLLCGVSKYVHLSYQSFEKYERKIIITIPNNRLKKLQFSKHNSPT